MLDRRRELGSRSEQIASSTTYATVLAGTRGRAAVDRLDQVVLLRVGLDTRAFRLPLPAQLRWFEIDWPELLEVALRTRANAPLIARSTEPPRRRTEPGRKYGVIPDRRVRTSHSLAMAPRLPFRVSATPAILERRERAAPLSSSPSVAIAQEVPT